MEVHFSFWDLLMDIAVSKTWPLTCYLLMSGTLALSVVFLLAYIDYLPQP